MRRLAIHVRARWRWLTGEADGVRRASAEIWSLVKARGVDDEPSTAAVPQLEWPVRGRLTSGFGMRHGRMHEGIDIAMDAGTPVRPAGEGTVIFAGELGVYGNLVIVGHGRNLATVYAHLSSISVAGEDRVEPQRPLGSVGSTGRSFGPHLHFEVRFDGAAVDPLVFLGELDRGDGEPTPATPAGRAPRPWPT